MKTVFCVVFLMTFLSAILSKFFDFRFAENPWIDAVIWGLTYGLVINGILKLIEKLKN